MSLQEALRLLRMELGLTQKDLAQKLDRTYLTVNRWENGNGFPTRKSAKNILEVARRCGASRDCIAYLNDVLMPDTARGAPASAYGFPEIDRDFLFRLADGSTNALYVIDAKTHKLLYLNRKAEQVAARNRKELMAVSANAKKKRTDVPCYEYFIGGKKPCTICPLSTIGTDKFQDVELTIPESGRTVRIHANAATNRGKEVYIIYLTDVTQENAERKALHEITNSVPAAVGIYHFYSDGRIEPVFLNTKWYEMIGEERQEALTQNAPADFCRLHPDDREPLLHEIKSALKEKRAVSFNVRMKIRDKGYRSLSLDAKVIREDEERITFYCLFHDAD